MSIGLVSSRFWTPEGKMSYFVNHHDGFWHIVGACYQVVGSYLKKLKKVGGFPWERDGCECCSFSAFLAMFSGTLGEVRDANTAAPSLGSHSLASSCLWEQIVNCETTCRRIIPMSFNCRLAGAAGSAASSTLENSPTQPRFLHVWNGTVRSGITEQFTSQAKC